MNENNADTFHAVPPTPQGDGVYPKVYPENRDHMPREVATEHLCNPKSRLSGAFRRACERARDTVYTSQFPIRLAADAPDGNPEHIVLFFKRPGVDKWRVYPRSSLHRVYDTTKTPKTAEARFNAKLREASWAKLHQILWRCDVRSDKAFRTAEKIMATDHPMREQVAEHFQAQAGKFDFLHGLTSAEIARRVAIVTTKSI